MVREKHIQHPTNIKWSGDPPTENEKKAQIRRLRISLQELGESHIRMEIAARKFIGELKKIAVAA